MYGFFITVCNEIILLNGSNFKIIIKIFLWLKIGTNQTPIFFVWGKVMGLIVDRGKLIYNEYKKWRFILLFCYLAIF